MGKKSNHKLPPGTWVERELFESKAFIALRGVAPQVLILFLARRWFDKIGHKGKEKRVCTNCHSIYFSYIEAEKKFGITKSRFSRALGDLLAKGFIDVVHKGGGYQQDKSIYALSDNWLRWRPGSVFEKRKKESVQRGFCKPKKEKSTFKIIPIHDNEIAPKRVALE